MHRSTVETSRTRRLATFAVLALYAVAVGVTVYLGFVRARDHFLSDYDTRFWFVGGVALWKGLSPYEHAEFVRLWVESFGERPVFRSGYVYPPTILPLSLLLGALPWQAAAWGMKVLSVAALVGAALVLRSEIVRRSGGDGLPWAREACVAMACALPSVGQTVYQGQVSLLVLLGFLLFWAGASRSRLSWICIGGFLALIKPQIALPAIVFVLASRRNRLPWAGVLSAALVGCVVFLWTTPDRFVADLGVSLSEHMEQVYNRFDRYDTMPGLLGGTSFASPALLAGVVVACGAAGLLGRTVRGESSFERHLRSLQVAVALGTVLMPVHHYDFAIEMILVATRGAWGVHGAP